MNAHPDTARADLRALSLLYFVAFSSTYLWTLLPRTMESYGWSGAAIGTLYSVRKMIDAPMMLFWGGLADRHNRKKIIGLQLTLGALCVAGIWLFLGAPIPLVAVILGYSATGACIFPVLDSLTISRVGGERYGKARGAGSAGYALVALLAAILGLWRDYTELAELAPLLLMITLSAAALCVVVIPDADGVARKKTSFIKGLACFKNPLLLALLALGALHWSCQSPLNIFLVALCESKGLPVWTPGLAVCVGVSCEFLLLTRSESLMKRLRPSLWVLLAIAISAVRWWAMSVTADPWVMVVMQVSHGISFGAFFMGSIALLVRYVPEEARSSGQAVFYLCVFGLGSVLGNVATGYVFDVYGVARCYEVAALMQLFLLIPGALFAWRVITR